MMVDCDRCAVRGDACKDCVITVLLGAPPSGVELDAAEQAALDTLAAAGMVPQLRLVDGDLDHTASGAARCAAHGAEPVARRASAEWSGNRAERLRRRVI